MKKTVASLNSKSKLKEKLEATPGRIILTEEQTKRVWGISQLEGGEDPSVIIDEMLNQDTVDRRYKLSIAKKSRLSKVLEDAIERGWEIKGKPSFVDGVTRLQYLHLLECSPETLQFFIDVLEETKKRGWTPKDFVTYVTRHHNEIQLYGRFKQRNMTLEQFEKEMEKYA